MNGSGSIAWAVLGGAVVAGLLCKRLGLERHRIGRSLLRLGGQIEVGLLATLLGVMVALAALQIVLRNAAGSGLVWIDPFLRLLTLWLGFLGAAFATGAGRHIQIDVLARISPPRVRVVAARVVSAVSSVVTLILAETSFRHLVDEHDFGATGVLGLPTWLLLVVMPIAFTLMSYRFLDRATRSTDPAPITRGGS